jgi:hypothetical protein
MLWDLPAEQDLLAVLVSYVLAGAVVIIFNTVVLHPLSAAEQPPAPIMYVATILEQAVPPPPSAVLELAVWVADVIILLGTAVPQAHSVILVIVILTHQYWYVSAMTTATVMMGTHAQQIHAVHSIPALIPRNVPDQHPTVFRGIATSAQATATAELQHAL